VLLGILNPVGESSAADDRVQGRNDSCHHT
jgi:hypothetical protein